MAYTITVEFPPISSAGGNTIDISLTIPVDASGTNTTVQAANHGINIVKVSDITMNYDIDEPLLVPAMVTVSLSDLECYLYELMFQTSETDKRAVLTIDLNGVDEFEGCIIEDTMDFDASKRLFTFTAAPKLDILNQTTVWYDNTAQNPLSYPDNDWSASGSPFPIGDYLIYTLLVDCFKRVDASCDIELSHGWDLKIRRAKAITWNVGDPIPDYEDRYEDLTGYNLSDMRLDHQAYYFDNVAGIVNLGDVVKSICRNFFAFAGMMSNKKAFFKQLFSEQLAVSIPAADILSYSTEYRYPVVDYVKMTNTRTNTPTIIEEPNSAAKTKNAPRRLEISVDNTFWDDDTYYNAIDMHYWPNIYGTLHLEYTGTEPVFPHPGVVIKAKDPKFDNVNYYPIDELIARINYDRRHKIKNNVVHKLKFKGCTHSIMNNYTITDPLNSLRTLTIQPLSIAKNLIENTTEIEGLVV